MSVRDMLKARWKGHGDDWPTGHRPCTKCGEMKPFAEFGKHKACKFGLNPVCKICNTKKAKREHRDKDPRAKIIHRAKQRAKSKGWDFDIDVEDIIIPTHCPALGIELKEKDYDQAPSIDRIDNSRGYVKGNIQIISNKANRIKCDATTEEVKAVLRYCEITDLGGTDS